MSYRDKRPARLTTMINEAALCQIAEPAHRSALPDRLQFV